MRVVRCLEKITEIDEIRRARAAAQHAGQFVHVAVAVAHPNAIADVQRRLETRSETLVVALVVARTPTVKLTAEPFAGDRTAGLDRREVFGVRRRLRTPRKSSRSTVRSSLARAAANRQHASAVSAAARRTSLRLRAILVERTEDVLHVVLRLGIRRHVTVFFDRVRTGVVRGHGQARVAFEAIEQTRAGSAFRRPRFAPDRRDCERRASRPSRASVASTLARRPARSRWR